MLDDWNIPITQLLSRNFPMVILDLAAEHLQLDLLLWIIGNNTYKFTRGKRGDFAGGNA